MLELGSAIQYEYAARGRDMKPSVKDNRIQLNTGQLLPKIGFGTWKLKDGTIAEHAVETALKEGYRLIDTASIYGNEGSIGRVIKKFRISRDRIFITTKLWTSDMGLGMTEAAYHKSLERLGMDYVDLYLIHWPANDAWKESWQDMEKLYREEKIRNIGVSNFTVEHLNQLRKIARLVPAVNQIELHPFNYRRQQPIIEFCNDKGIVVEAYSPLAQMVWYENPVLNRFAKFYSKSVAQIMLRWSIQHGAIPIPKATSVEHIRSNLQVFDFQLSEAEMTALDNLSF